MVDNLSSVDVGVKFASSGPDNIPNNLTKDNSFRVRAGKRKSIPTCIAGYVSTSWAFSQWGTFRFGKDDKYRVPFAVKCSAWSLMSDREYGIGLCSFDKMERQINRSKPKFLSASWEGLTFTSQLWEDKEEKGYFSWHFIVKDSFPSDAVAETSKSSKSKPPAPKSEQTIILVNHAARLDQSNSSWAKKASRPHDPPLSIRGYSQAHKLGKFLQKKAGIRKVDHIITSPFIRCVQTADILAQEYQSETGCVTIEEGLCEKPKLMDKALEPWFLPAADLCVACPLLDPSAKSSLHSTFFARGKRYPGPPSEEEGFRNRCKNAATTLMEHKHLKKKTIILVSHLATIKQWLRAINPKLETPDLPDSADDLKELDCSFTILTRKRDSKKFKLLGSVFSTDHLDKTRSARSEAEF